MSILGLVLAVAGAAIAFASNWLIEKLPWTWADSAVVWLKPFALYVMVFGLGGVTLGLVGW